MGLFLSDLDSDDILIWPDNWQAFEIFEAIRTQWRVGMNGPSGLDYNVIPQFLRLYQIPRADHRDLYDAIRVMEDAALLAIHEEK